MPYVDVIAFVREARVSCARSRSFVVFPRAGYSLEWDTSSLIYAVKHRECEVNRYQSSCDRVRYEIFNRAQVRFVSMHASIRMTLASIARLFLLRHVVIVCFWLLRTFRAVLSALFECIGTLSKVANVRAGDYVNMQCKLERDAKKQLRSLVRSVVSRRTALSRGILHLRARVWCVIRVMCYSGMLNNLSDGRY